MGPGSSAAVAKLGGGFLRHDRFRDSVFWPDRERRTADAGNFRRPLSRIYVANLSHYTDDLLKAASRRRNVGEKDSREPNCGNARAFLATSGKENLFGGVS